VKRFKVGDLVLYYHKGGIYKIHSYGSLYDYRIIEKDREIKDTWHTVADDKELRAVIRNNKLNKVLYPDWIEKGEWLHESFND